MGETAPELPMAQGLAARLIAEHRPSTLQDIRAGRRTEIDALNGAVVKLAEKHGIDAPYNSIAFHLVKALEAKRSSVCKDQ
jgi:2-dehydropantoate 2-reductase